MNIIVCSLSQCHRQGYIRFAENWIPCALGKTGCSALKKEGDGSTPIGPLPVRGVCYRSDRIARPQTLLPIRPIRHNDGWCDDPNDRNYNRFVQHPYPASAERLWRDDHLYDLVVLLGYNDVPRVKGRGSAIFMHLAKHNYEPTEGCIAAKLGDLRLLLAQMNLSSRIHVKHYAPFAN